MEQIVSVVVGLPLWAYIAAAAVLLAIVALIVVATLIRRRFRKALEAIASGEEGAGEAFRKRYGRNTVLRRTGLIERALRVHPQSELVAETGIGALWIERLDARGRERDFRRVLYYVGGYGLWACFRQALRNEQRARRFLSWLGEHESWQALRETALASDGERFDARRAVLLLRDYIDQVREMTGEPDWRIRLFAVRIMLEDGSQHSERGLWESTVDGDARVRGLLASRFEPEDKDRLLEVLSAYVLHDPVFDVRKAARQRIRESFPERYRVELGELASHEAAHVLELLAPDSTEDENAALAALAGSDLEQRLPAARYLLAEGTLARMVREAHIGDRERFDRTVALLRNAAEVHVAEYLEAARESREAGPLLAALRVLGSYGPVRLIAPYAERALEGVDDPEHENEVVEAALTAVRERGDERALRVLQSHIAAARHEQERLARLLRYVPARGAEILRPTLLELLTDPACPTRSELTDALLRFGPGGLVPSLIEVVRNESGSYPHDARVHALHVLGRFELPYCLTFLLEQLPILTNEEARAFAHLLVETQPEAFDGQVERLLATPDAGVRSAVIAVLPGAGRKGFAKQVREALDDASPEVRSAAVWALVEFGDSRSFKQAADRLRDPVERVRVEAAKALGSTGSDDVLEQLRTNILDESEVSAVKEAAVIGLGNGGVPKAVDLLIETLESYPEHRDAAIAGLARMTDRKPLEHLIERFKDAEPKLREELSTAFRQMGEPGERAMLDLLREQIESLAPLISQVLEETGAVESTIRRLNHRDASVRREAASTLAMIGTEGAFRGIVQAARDPDQQVRVEVTRALEQLGSQDGNDILTHLTEDPDRRVRKYTQWAMERVRTKSL
jgi:HEAT repeat protein